MFSARSILLVCALCPCAPAGARASDEPAAAAHDFGPEHEAAVEAIAREAREDSQVAIWLLTLTKAIGPRLTASPNLDRAYEWALASFRAMGLEARLETYDEWPLGFERGPSYGRVVGDTEDLVFMTGAWTRGTEGAVRGRALLSPRSFEELEERQPLLAGAWLVEGPRRRIADRDERQRFAEALDAAEAEAGIAGRVSVSRAKELLKMGGTYAKSLEEVMEREVRITLVASQHAALVERLSAGEELELEFDVDNRFVPGPRPLRNVVADLVGSDYPNEYVIVQSHLDSWDLAEGAADNGTGCATTLEAARLLVRSGARPKRTVRFVLYSGEEQGLYGSRAYVRDHADELEAISMVLNHDHGTNHLQGILCTEAMRPQLERVFAPVVELDLERPFHLIPVEAFPPGGSSDHASFVNAGVPAIHWAQNEDGYYHIHHTQNDVFELADQDEQRHSSMVIAIAALGLANLEHLVDRTGLKEPAPRKMGVSLRGLTVASVNPGGRAAGAGWKAGDEIVEIDGVRPSSRKDVVDAVQAGEAEKRFVLQRGEERVESTLDWSDDPEEAARALKRESEETEASETVGAGAPGGAR